VNTALSNRDGRDEPGHDGGVALLANVSGSNKPDNVVRYKERQGLYFILKLHNRHVNMAVDIRVERFTSDSSNR
jgi:hypothetical protein